MSDMRTPGELLAENAELRHRLDVAEETLRAITSGEVDALVVNTKLGEQVFTLQGADTVYRIAIENINEGAINLSPEGAILYSNQHFARMMRTDLNRVIGASIYDFATPGSRELIAALLEYDGRSEVTLRSGDGTQVPAYLAARKMQLDDLVSVGVVVTDLTQQKRNEEIITTGNLIRAILEQTPNAVIVGGADGNIIHASKVAHRLFGRNVLGQAMDDVLGKIHVSGRPLRFADIQSDDIRHGTTICTMQNGKRLYLLLLYGKLVGNGDTKGYVVSLADVTQLKEAEEALRLAKEQLDAAFLNSPVVAFRQDTDLRYTWLYNPNRALAQGAFIGKTDEEIFGTQAEPLIKAK